MIFRRSDSYHLGNQTGLPLRCTPHSSVFARPASDVGTEQPCPHVAIHLDEFLGDQQGITHKKGRKGNILILLSGLKLLTLPFFVPFL